MKKHIVCIGDSNTHGYCADPADVFFHEETSVLQTVMRL